MGYPRVGLSSRACKHRQSDASDSSISTLDPTVALSAKAGQEIELRILFEESGAFTRTTIEPVTESLLSHEPAPVFGYIYKVTHKPTGRVYIGQPRNMVILRWREHARAAHTPGMDRSFRKP
jgi:hypothetical protein